MFHLSSVITTVVSNRMGPIKYISLLKERLQFICLLFERSQLNLLKVLVSNKRFTGPKSYTFSSSGKKIFTSMQKIYTLAWQTIFWRLSGRVRWNLSHNISFRRAFAEAKISTYTPHHHHYHQRVRLIDGVSLMAGVAPSLLAFSLSVSHPFTRNIFHAWAGG